MSNNINPNDLLGEIISRITQLEDSIEGQPVEDQVEIGAALWAVTERATQAMEQAKKDIRDEAVEQLGGPGTHTFNGNGTTQALVTIPNPSLKLQKDADVELLQKILGGDFDRYFDTKTTYSPRKEFNERRASDKDGTHTAMLDKYVDVMPNTPRVTFRRMDQAATG